MAKLDQLSRSVAQASAMLDQAAKGGWRIFSADLEIDTITPAGEAAAGMMIVFSQRERRLISQRAKGAIAIKKAQGMRLGRPSVLPHDVVNGIVHARHSGQSVSTIARNLTTANVPTASGVPIWHASTVRAVLFKPRCNEHG
ncbi:recombinase family protein [Rhodococcoides navarretei]|uniref:Recombinase family protein n=1 Tax=Rhodococcus navarretei TaxID=3128981 RepID=A0ABU9CSQ0_9NOCA